MNKCLKNKKTLYILIFIIGILITLPSIIPSFNVDAYCTMACGYLDSAKTFMKSGRIFTALSYFLANKANISLNIFSITSILLANIFLSLSIYKLYNHLKKYVKDNILKKFSILIGTFLTIYNPLVIELFLFEESFIMCLGLYLVILSALNFLKWDKKHLLLSLLYVILGCICYQGIMCFYIPIIFMLVVFELKGNIKKEYIDFIKKGFFALLFYGIALIISFILVKLINTFIYVDGTEKLGKIDIIFNIKQAVRLMIFSLKGMFGFVNKPVFYISAIIFLIIPILGKINKKDNYYWIKILYLIVNLILCIGMPFVPNLGMNSDLNYTAARMIGSMGSIIGVLIIYAIIYFDIISNKIFKIILIITVSLYTIYNSVNFFYTSHIGLQRYKKDMESISIIHDKITEYELETDYKIETIKYTQDSQVAPIYYENILTNSYNYRVYSTPWAMDCALNIGPEHNYVFIEMNEEEKNKYFGENEYSKLDDDQFIFEKNTLYLLLY